jgi:DNA polymerase kappa
MRLIHEQSEMGDPTEFRNKLRWTAEELEKDMVRTQFKGRTLCLKVKLHTFEVFTRQVVPPKLVYLAEDLYKYSLPMLSKLEQEFPGMRLRLMGLRCTHLVTMKKPDTLSFFGFKRKSVGNNDSDSLESGKRKADALNEDEEWETWPDERLFEDAERQEREDDLHELETLSQELDKRRHHGKEIVPNPKKADTPEEEWWDCPICSRPQAPSEKEFNAHIDLCLSRETIRDVVQETSTAAAPQDHAPVVKRVKNDKGRNKNNTYSDPKQSRLFFG